MVHESFRHDNAIHIAQVAYHVALEDMAATAADDSPKFVFAHLIIPHPPFAFHSDGTYRIPLEPYSLNDGDHYIRDRRYRQYRNGYVEQVEFINRMLEKTVDSILAVNPGCVIILQGDHGGGLLFNQQEIEKTFLKERFTLFCAVLLPGGNSTGLYPDITPVNIFRIVFNRIFRTGFFLEPDRSWYSPLSNIFSLTEITGRISDSEKPLKVFDWMADKYRN